MANRRMFSKKITNSSEFLMMSQSAQNLYFHLGMNADDDGICELFTVMRMTDSKPDDLQLLHSKGFVFVVDNRVLIIKDWNENNYIRPDRYEPSIYLQEGNKDFKNLKNIYEMVMYKNTALLSPTSSGIPNDNQRSTQDRLGKDRKGKEKLKELEDSFEEFYKEYPKKVAKAKAKQIWLKIKPSIELFHTMMEAVKKQKQSEQWKKDNGQFVPYPSTWLNQQRWTDEIKIIKSNSITL